jgi:histone deacetylase 1/2
MLLAVLPSLLLSVGQGHNLSLVYHTRRYKVPTLVVGGGGYTLRNVARCWCYETGRLMGHDLPDKLPDSVLNSFNYYMDNEKLRIEVGCTAIVLPVLKDTAIPMLHCGGASGALLQVTCERMLPDNTWLSCV